MGAYGGIPETLDGKGLLCAQTGLLHYRNGHSSWGPAWYVFFSMVGRDGGGGSVQWQRRLE